MRVYHNKSSSNQNFVVKLTTLFDSPKIKIGLSYL
jgi:hypothetical protein